MSVFKKISPRKKIVVMFLDPQIKFIHLCPCFGAATWIFSQISFQICVKVVVRNSHVIYMHEHFPENMGSAKLFCCDAVWLTVANVIFFQKMRQTLRDKVTTRFWVNEKKKYAPFSQKKTKMQQDILII